MGALLGCSDAPSLGHQEHPEGEAMGGGAGPRGLGAPLGSAGRSSGPQGFADAPAAPISPRPDLGPAETWR